jgi:hypothetical protein
MVEVLLLVTFSMLAKIVALLFPYCQAQLNVFSGDLEWGIDLTLPGSVFKVPLISYLPGIPPQEGPVNLALANPKQCFQGEWDPSQLEPTTFLLGMLHICLPLPIKHVQFCGHGFFGFAERSCCNHSFQQTMAKDVPLQYFVVLLSASFDLCIQTADSGTNYFVRA